MTHRPGTALVVILALAGTAATLTGCGSSRSTPAGSTFAPTATSPAPAGSQKLNGYVGDTGFRRIAGADVEVLDGPQAGMRLTSDANGEFTFTGVFSGGVTMRATKEGYVPATETVRIYPSGPYVFFSLVSLVAPVQIAGDYTLTITADSSCTSLPEDVRTRSYSASLIEVRNGNAPANTFFSGHVTGGQFYRNASSFWIGVSGDYLGISTDLDGPSLVEEVETSRYVAYAIDAAATGVTSGAVSISVPFTGTIEYCESSSLGAYYDCTVYARREQCTGTNGRLTLTRR